MASPPPHGKSLGLWKVTHKVSGVLILTKEDVNKPVIVPVTEDQFNYFEVGSSWSFSATQP